jgi:cob(I)alamin adenosyltransferase
VKIYTKTGDRGTTGLFGGPRVSKAHARVDAYGEVDELVSLMGLIRTLSNDDELTALLGDIQLELFLLSSELATPEDKKIKGETIQEEDIVRLEREIDRCDEEIPPLRSFILPGGSPVSAWLQYARTVCRRSERAVVRLMDEHQVRDELLRYLNRLSDLFFALGRRANVRDGVEEVLVEDLRQQRAKRRST